MTWIRIGSDSAWKPEKTGSDDFAILNMVSLTREIAFMLLITYYSKYERIPTLLYVPLDTSSLNKRNRFGHPSLYDEIKLYQ